MVYEVPAVETSWILGAIGGVMIGLAAALLLLTRGRMAGISGILGHVIAPDTKERTWRVQFIISLLVVGVVASQIVPHTMVSSPRALPLVAIGGVLVGFGTRMSGGCTSGHGVCGLGRMSERSLVAVCTFIATGALTAWIVGGV